MFDKLFMKTSGAVTPIGLIIYPRPDFRVSGEVIPEQPFTHLSHCLTADDYK